jgi:hypothetical protein
MAFKTTFNNISVISWQSVLLVEEAGVPREYNIFHVLNLLWFSEGTSISSTNKTDHHNLTEILLKVALGTISHIKPIAAIVFYFQRESVVEIDQRKTDHCHPFLPELMDKLR